MRAVWPWSMGDLRRRWRSLALIAPWPAPAGPTPPSTAISIGAGSPR
ncbi:MAG: hypothetical protein ACRD0A_00285 [Acidimicrobiales bacterium]